MPERSFQRGNAARTGAFVFFIGIARPDLDGNAADFCICKIGGAVNALDQISLVYRTVNGCAGTAAARHGWKNITS